MRERWNRGEGMLEEEGERQQSTEQQDDCEAGEPTWIMRGKTAVF